MRTGLGNEAYTLIEVMVFLAVSVFLLFAVTLSINGQQSKTQFNQAVRDFESRLLDVANDVSTGFYNSNNNFRCTSTPTSDVVIVGASQEKGTNDGCILAGEVVQFTTGSPTFTLYPLAGKQRTRIGAEDREVTTLGQANPKAITTNTTTETISYQIPVSRVTARGATVYNVQGLAFTNNFVGYSPVTGELNTGDIHVDVIPLVNASTGSVNGLGTSGWTALELTKNPVNGIVICLQDGNGSSARHADVRLGGSGRQLSTDVDFANGACS